jgi:hypothetical protein
MYEVPTIQRIVKEIDPRFDCEFDHKREAYVITQTSPLGVVSVFDRIRYDRLNKSFFDHIREMVYINRNGDPAREVEESNARFEKRNAEREEQNIEYLAKSTGPRMLQAFKEI